MDPSLINKASTFVYTATETQYFSGSQIQLMRFVDLQSQIYAAYQEANVANVCPQGFRLVGANNCYRLLTDTSYDWNQADAACQMLNSRIASFETRTELDQTRAWLQSSFPVLTNNIWTSGRYVNNRWVWSVTSNLTIIPNEIINFYWAPTKPSSTPLTEDAILLSVTNALLFTNDSPGKRQFSVLCRAPAFKFNPSSVILTPIRQQGAIGTAGQNLIGYTYQINVTSNFNLLSVAQPSTTIYSGVYAKNPLTYGQYYADIAYVFNNPFVIGLCGDLTGSQVETIRVNILNYWLTIRPEFKQCNCFNIHVYSVDKYTTASNAPATRITYVARANSLILETNSTGPMPTMAQIYQSLSTAGFSQCALLLPRSALLDLSAEGRSLLVASDESLKSSVKSGIMAIRPDFSTNNQSVDVSLQMRQEGIDVVGQKPATKYYLSVKVGDSDVDFARQDSIDVRRLVEEINSGSNARMLVSLGLGLYPMNYFVTLYSKQPVAKSQYDAVAAELKRVFLAAYPQFGAAEVNVSTPLAELYVNSDAEVVYGLSLLISIGNRPADDLVSLDRSLFASIKLTDSAVQFFVPSGFLVPLSSAISIYSDKAIAHNDVKTFCDAFAKTIEAQDLGKIFK